jgi:2-dehydro-3-deoxy-D-arabinonate dehydratase
MHLGQIKFKHSFTAAIEEDDMARPIPGYTVIDLIHRAQSEGVSLPDLARRLASRHCEKSEFILPIHPPEIWACGCTYKTSAEFRDTEHGEAVGIYDYVHRSPRPEIFMKGTARVCVGPNQPVGIRADSKFTAPEPELALILGSKGKILGYTLANDVSAWDIERENPLYLPQSKVYTACCSLGPAIVTVDEIEDPYSLDMRCTITRNGQERFSGSINLSQLARKFEEMVDYLTRSNPVPAGSVLLTGTGIIVTEESKLEPGDVVTISTPEIGVLSNPCITV